MFMIPSEYRAYYNNVTHKIGDTSDFNKLYGSNPIFGPMIPNNSWHYAVVTDAVYNIRTGRDLKKYLTKLFTSKTTLIRDSRTDNKDIMENTLDRPYISYYDYFINMPLLGINTKPAIDAMKDHIRHMI